MAVAVTTSAAVLLIAFAAIESVQLRRTTRERDRADRVTEFMTDMFNVSDPSEARGNTITAREILDKSAKEIDTRLTTDPVLQAQMMHLMARVYLNLGLFARSEGLSRRAAEIRVGVLGAEDRDTLASRTLLVESISQQGRYSDAAQMGRALLDTQRRVLGADHRDTLVTEGDLAHSLHEDGRLREAEAVVRDTLARQQRAFGPESQDALKSADRLARILSDEGRFPEAESLYRKNLEIRRRLLGPEDRETLLTMNSLAITLTWEKRLDESEQLLRQDLAIENRILGPEHPSTLDTLDTLGVTLEHAGSRERVSAGNRRETQDPRPRSPTNAGVDGESRHAVRGFLPLSRGRETATPGVRSSSSRAWPESSGYCHGTLQHRGHLLSRAPLSGVD
jgi:non-specific serine/threonine protein kinase/serine/threonine-protein kinase